MYNNINGRLCLSNQVRSNVDHVGLEERLCSEQELAAVMGPD